MFIMDYSGRAWSEGGARAAGIGSLDERGGGRLGLM